MTKSQSKQATTCVVIPVEEFFFAKVKWFRECFWNSRHTEEQYVHNMVHMGFTKRYIRNSLNEEN
jgi:hypothetical protein